MTYFWNFLYMIQNVITVDGILTKQYSYMIKLDTICPTGKLKRGEVW